MQGAASRAPGSDLMVGKRFAKNQTFLPLDQRPGFLIRRLHQIHVALFQKNALPLRLRRSSIALLSALAQRGTADQTTLAADVALDRTTTTGALKRLQLRRLSNVRFTAGSPGADLPADKDRRSPAAGDRGIGAAAHLETVSI